MQTYYNHETHEYFIDGERVPSVTELLPKQQFFCTDFQLEKARDEGAQLHSIIKMYLDTGEDYDNPHVKQFKLFMDEYSGELGKLLFCETPLFSYHKFAGTPDYIFERGIVDLKRSRGDKKMRALQCAGYHIIVEEKCLFLDDECNWYNLILTEDKFTAIDVTIPLAKLAFMSLLKKYHAEKELENYFKKEQKVNGK